MKKTYTIKAIKKTFIQVTVEDDNVSKDIVYDLAMQKANSKSTKYEDAICNITKIDIDDDSKGPSKPQVSVIDI